MLGALGAAGTFGSGLFGGLGAAFAAETPKKGGRIRVAGFSSSTADTLDPANGYCTSMTTSLSALPTMDLI